MEQEVEEPLNIVINDGRITFNGLSLTDIIGSNDRKTILELKSVGDLLSKLTLSSEDGENSFNITRDRKMVENTIQDNGTVLGHGNNVNMILNPNGDTTFFGNVSTFKKNIIKFNGGPTECLPLLDENGVIIGYIPIYSVN